MSSNGAVPFGEIAKQVSKRVEPSTTDAEVYYGLEHLDPENLRIKRWGRPAEVKGQKLAVKEGQIIFGKRRAYQRRLAVARADGICSAHAMVLEANPETILPGLLPFATRIDPMGFKGMVVVYDREACVMMKQRLDARLGAGASEVVMITSQSDVARWKKAGLEVEEDQFKHSQELDKDDAELKRLELAKDLVRQERESEDEVVPDKKEALSAIFEDCRLDTTPEMVGRIVDDIDTIVSSTRFDGWQGTVAGEREVKQALSAQPS